MEAGRDGGREGGERGERKAVREGGERETGVNYYIVREGMDRPAKI